MTKEELIKKIQQLEKQKEVDIKNQHYSNAADKRDLIMKYTNQLEELRKTNEK